MYHYGRVFFIDNFTDENMRWLLPHQLLKQPQSKCAMIWYKVSDTLTF